MMSVSRRAFAALVLGASFAVPGCITDLFLNVPPVPVAELDAHGVSLARVQQLARGDRAELVVRLLGEPTDRQPSCVPGEFVWRYPIRAWNDIAETRRIVPAALLRATFDSTGSLVAWAFVDASTGHSLPVRESLDEAERWFESLSRAPTPIPPRIKVDECLVPGRTTQDEAESAFGRWYPDIFCGAGGRVPLLRKTQAASGTVLEWYVDRPSPLFVPPMYVVVTFDQAGALVAWHMRQTYPGGRK